MHLFLGSSYYTYGRLIMNTGKLNSFLVKAEELKDFIPKCNAGT